MLGDPNDYGDTPRNVYFQIGGDPQACLASLESSYLANFTKSVDIYSNGFSMRIPQQVIPEVVSVLCKVNHGIY